MTIRLSPRPIQCRIRWFPEVKRPEREDDQSPSSSVEVYITPTPRVRLQDIMLLHVSLYTRSWKLSEAHTVHLTSCSRIFFKSSNHFGLLGTFLTFCTSGQHWTLLRLSSWWVSGYSERSIVKWEVTWCFRCTAGCKQTDPGFQNDADAA
jgi:hypothetical protein